eukprot:GHVU01052683.1.p1 GENE.GHVU01052683.1~~GHVU01052683.1.p1  ORF type:complete len:117 (-),score=8.85 GHVU01052683.1:311-661(-)
MKSDTLRTHPNDLKDRVAPAAPRRVRHETREETCLRACTDVHGSTRMHTERHHRGSFINRWRSLHAKKTAATTTPLRNPPCGAFCLRETAEAFWGFRSPESVVVMVASLAIGGDAA